MGMASKPPAVGMAAGVLIPLNAREGPEESGHIGHHRFLDEEERLIVPRAVNPRATAAFARHSIQLHRRLTARLCDSQSREANLGPFCLDLASQCRGVSMSAEREYLSAKTKRDQVVR
jgi:hypothetical protein